MKTKTDDYQTTRIWVKTQKRLKLISALTGVPIVQVLDRLSLEELRKLQEKDIEHG